MKTILYARVSTGDQTIAHQEAQAAAVGFVVDEVVADDGVSGLSTCLRERPQGRRLFDLLRRGVVVRTVIHRLTFDGATADPMQQAVRDALIGFMAATAQAQAEAMREAQKVGIAQARARSDVYRGRKPSFSRAQYEAVRSALVEGRGISAIAVATGLSRQTVYRIRDNAAEAEAALARWA
jgi:putative DNA-invertase from lambdoid prophage Rac